MHQQHATPGLDLSETPPPPPSIQIPFSGRRKHTKWVNQQSLQGKANCQLLTTQSKLIPWGKNKKVIFLWSPIGKAGHWDCHDSPLNLEAPSLSSNPSPPVLRELGLPSVTFPAYPMLGLPANKSFHAGRHNHPAEPLVNFPLPFWFTYFFSVKTNKNKRELTDSKGVCGTSPPSHSPSLWPSHSSLQKATFPSQPRRDALQCRKPG